MQSYESVSSPPPNVLVMFFLVSVALNLFVLSTYFPFCTFHVYLVSLRSAFGVDFAAVILTLTVPVSVSNFHEPIDGLAGTENVVVAVLTGPMSLWLLSRRTLWTTRVRRRCVYG